MGLRSRNKGKRGERILRTVGGPSCVAKNRYGLDAELPLDWTALLGGIAGAAQQS